MPVRVHEGLQRQVICLCTVYCVDSDKANVVRRPTDGQSCRNSFDVGYIWGYIASACWRRLAVGMEEPQIGRKMGLADERLVRPAERKEKPTLPAGVRIINVPRGVVGLVTQFAVSYR